MENNNVTIVDQDLQWSIRAEKDIVTDLLPIHQLVLCGNWLGTVRNRPLKRQAGARACRLRRVSDSECYVLIITFVLGLLFDFTLLSFSYRNPLTLTHARRARWGSWHGLVMVSGCQSVWIPRSAYTTHSHTSIYKTWISSLTSARCWVTLASVTSTLLIYRFWLEMSLVVT